MANGPEVDSWSVLFAIGAVAVAVGVGGVFLGLPAWHKTRRAAPTALAGLVGAMIGLGGLVFLVFPDWGRQLGLTFHNPTRRLILPANYAGRVFLFLQPGETRDEAAYRVSPEGTVLMAVSRRNLEQIQEARAPFELVYPDQSRPTWHLGSRCWISSTKDPKSADVYCQVFYVGEVGGTEPDPQEVYARMKGLPQR